MLAGDALSAWQNHELPADVTSDGRVTVLDALRIINALNTSGPVRPRGTTRYEHQSHVVHGGR